MALIGRKVQKKLLATKEGVLRNGIDVNLGTAYIMDP
jgi:hypothetical protein